MTIATTSNKAQWQGNGATTVFSFPFEIGSASQAALYLSSGGTISLIPQNAYQLNGLGAPSGGTVTYPLSGSPIASGATLTLILTVPLQQLVDLINQSNYFPDAVEGGLDYLMMAIQQLALQLSYCLQTPESDPVLNLTLPDATGRASTIVGFDVNGNVISLPVTTSIGAGDLVAELGSNGKPGFKAANGDFTPGTTTTLTLSKSYGSVANTWVFFDGGYQQKDSYAISGAQITFNAPIPVGIENVDIVGGTTLSVGEPADGTVTNAKVAAGAAIDSSKLDYTQAATGGVARTLQSKFAESVSVTDFGADPTGVADSTAAIQDAINAVSSRGGIVHFPPGTFNISSSLVLSPGVSLYGAGATEDFELTLSVYVTRINWVGANNGTMLNAGSIYNGTIRDMVFDGMFQAGCIWLLGCPRNALFKNCVLARTNNTTNGFSLNLDIRGQTSPPEYPTQFPSASANTFENIIVRSASFGAAHFWGLTGSLFTNCAFYNTAGSGYSCVVFEQECDTNQFIGGMISSGSGSGSGGTALNLNFNSTGNNDVYGVNFFGTAFEVTGAGIAVDARNNATHCHFYGCYFPTGGTQVATAFGSAPGKVKIWGSSGWPDSNGFRPPYSLTPGASPWTWTNDSTGMPSGTSPGQQIELKIWAPSGNLTGMSIVRNGAATGLGGVTDNPNQISLLLEPNDGVILSWGSGSAPSVMAIPH